jgi:putative restriction endonuclease
MPRLPKKAQLLARFEEAVRLCGWSVIYLAKNDHPARYQIYREGRSYRVKVYIWNITHGGATRAVDEYRIQITGVTAFQPENNARNLILGWWEDVSVFAGWDIRQHVGVLGASPSMQVSEGALRQSQLTGFAPYVNRKGETAIAFRPDFISTYIEFLENIHDSGTMPAEIELLAKLSEDPDAVQEEDIEYGVSEQRKYAMLSTKRAIRALDFSRRVLGAYEHKFAICGMQLRMVDSAHILPVADPNSTDQTANGVALCTLHHRAYDRGLVTFDSKFRVHINKAMVEILVGDDRADGLDVFKRNLRPFILTPADKRDRPARAFVDKANHLRGWRV